MGKYQFLLSFKASSSFFSGSSSSLESFILSLMEIEATKIFKGTFVACQ